MKTTAGNAETEVIKKDPDFLVAVQYGHLEKVQELILNGISPESKDADGCYMMHWVMKHRLITDNEQ